MMENLQNHIKLTDETIRSKNLCGLFTPEDLVTIGTFCKDTYNRDLTSREPWYRKNQEGLNLAMQLQESKSFPWQGCSNVKFPLITIAAMQFHARAYPAIINGRDIVKCRIIGGDPGGIQRARADRIQTHMSWQLLEQNLSWEEDADRSLLVLPIVGTVFKKSYNSASDGYNTSELVLPQNLVFDYWAKSVEDCPVKTHIIPMHRNKIHENVKRERYVDVLDDSWFIGSAAPRMSPFKEQENKRESKTSPQSDENTPFTICEQHCVLDLDGDGYCEPYVVTFEEDSGVVLRIVSRCLRIEDVEFNNDGEVIRCNPWECFTKYPFIPSPDGGVLDIGFGTLLGPLNESVNSAINQLFDAGTMSNTAGGFLGRGAKVRGGQIEFNPFGWQRVDSTGDDLRKNLFPLPVREPSAVMFNLLNLLIEYTQRISGSTDMMVGVTPGQNTPAETARNAVEQSEKVYSAIFKRVWRSMKGEFRKLYQLNSIYLPQKFTFGEGGAFVLREDYAVSGADVIPLADPTIVSASARFARASMVKAAAQAGGGYDQDYVERQWLRDLGIDDIDAVYPGAGSPKATPAPPNEKIEIQKMKNEAAAAELNYRKWEFITELQATMRLNESKIKMLDAQAFKMVEEGKGEEGKQMVNAFNAATTALRDNNNQMEMHVNRMLEEMKDVRESGNNRVGGALQTVEGSPGNAGLPQLPQPVPAGADGGLGG